MTQPASALPVDALQRNAIGWEVTQHVYAFFRNFDDFRYDLMARAFTADGVWDRSGLVLNGREAIITELSRRPATAQVRHVISNVLVKIQAADRASVSFYNTAYRHPGPTPADGKTPRIRAPFLLVLGEGQLALRDDQWLFTHQSARRLFEFED